MDTSLDKVPNPFDEIEIDPEFSAEFEEKHLTSYLSKLRSNVLPCFKSVQIDLGSAMATNLGLNLNSPAAAKIKEEKIEEAYKKEFLTSPTLDQKSKSSSLNSKAKSIGLTKPDLVIVSPDPTNPNIIHAAFCHTNIVCSNSAILITWTERSVNSTKRKTEYLTMMVPEFSMAAISVFLIFCYTSHLSYNNLMFEELVKLGHQFRCETFLDALQESTHDNHVI